MKVFTNNNDDIRSGWRIGIFAIIYMAMSFISSILLGIIIGITQIGKDRNQITNGIMNFLSGQTGMIISKLISVIVLLVTIFILVKLIEKKTFSDIGLNSIRNRGGKLLFGLLLGAGSMAIIFFILLAKGDISLINSLSKPNFTLNSVLGIVLFTIVAIDEEVMCRGYIYNTLGEGIGELLAAIVSSLIFGALHLGNPNVKVFGIINIVLVGILFCVMVMRTKSLWMPIGYHLTWNYFQGNVFGFPVSGTTNAKGIYSIVINNDSILSGGAFGPEAGILTTIVIILSIILVEYMYRKTSK